jgi:NAD(P)-dependent dehydrogenase (short-subunit alcohol dehydrogenase family)
MDKNIPNFRLDDRTAIITGGAGGIGRAVSLCIAAAGAYVVILDSNGAPLRKSLTKSGQTRGRPR